MNDPGGVGYYFSECPIFISPPPSFFPSVKISELKGLGYASDQADRA